MPIRIEEDESRSIVTINGQQFSGFVQEFKCETCNNSIVYDEDFDSHFCPGCNVWTENHPVCTDWWCAYCRKTRPDRPLRESAEE